MKPETQHLGIQSNIRVISNEESDRQQGVIDAFRPGQLARMKHFVLYHPLSGDPSHESDPYVFALDLRDPLNPTAAITREGPVAKLKARSEPVIEDNVIYYLVLDTGICMLNRTPEAMQYTVHDHFFNIRRPI